MIHDSWPDELYFAKGESILFWDMPAASCLKPDIFGYKKKVAEMLL